MKIPSHLANFLSILKISLNAKLPNFSVIYSNQIFSILTLFFNLGYIQGFLPDSALKTIKVFLFYSFNSSPIRSCFLISKPSRRFYIKFTHLKKNKLNNFLYKNGFVIYSTSQGYMTDVEALILGIGGEPVLFID